MTSQEQDAGGVRLWTAKNVAERLAVSLAWVYLHAEERYVAIVRIGGLRRFIPLEIEAFVRGVELPPRELLQGPGSRKR